MLSYNSHPCMRENWGAVSYMLIMYQGASCFPVDMLENANHKFTVTFQ